MAALSPATWPLPSHPLSETYQIPCRGGEACSPTTLQISCRSLKRWQNSSRFNVPGPALVLSSSSSLIHIPRRLRLKRLPTIRPSTDLYHFCTAGRPRRVLSRRRSILEIDPQGAPHSHFAAWQRKPVHCASGNAAPARLERSDTAVAPSLSRPANLIGIEPEMTRHQPVQLHTTPHNSRSGQRNCWREQTQGAESLYVESRSAVVVRHWLRRPALPGLRRPPGTRCLTGVRTAVQR